ncbi:ABC transporter ATP-binding protein [Algoriphagus zhangzhouensis]|uniref:ABC-type multidrug transport system, ATPase component n=1 Tax=Algoriphagus zhangzhouensis TaxID=1073327 RepID=A0A1M7ZFW3_9BACT|nr:ABC transporter ATP-binding protein [Algoriphagus zhangzhouensis]TDY44941.1 ABC-type multidrug transport system ATPase subunit [Algoriphagus zhangzhouensis]SHO63768.1 ABC-type multidrug transport system, ATPase component [Algoriphagus zhangzhouensis]
MELVISNLSKTYSNGVRALNDVSLTIPQGMFGLLGPNGAGKSTLMRTISTLQDADFGSISLDGIDVLKDKQTVRERLGYLPQDFGLYPRINAETMLDHIAQMKGVGNSGERKELVASLLNKVNLYKDRKKGLGTYSGGMRQRFGIAQALVGNPSLIIVDEPTAGLDPSERNRFYNLLSEIGENTIVILSTHIVEDVNTLCSNMAIICMGEVLMQGKPKDGLAMVDGKIYQKSIEKSDLDQYRQDYNLISTKLIAGKLSLRIESEEDPGNGFEPSPADLEDVYFSFISKKVDPITL